jgi:hypothetical protein
MERRTPMPRGKGLNRGEGPGRSHLRAVPAPPPGVVLDFPAIIAARDARAARRSDHADMIARLGVTSGTARHVIPLIPAETDPDFAAAVRDLIVGRFPGLRCDLARFGVVKCRGMGHCHHRCRKGMGGSSRGALGLASNGIAVCAAHHDWIHFQQPRRARDLGLLLPTSTPDPAGVRVSMDGGLTWMVLDNAGGYRVLRGGAA